MNRKTSAHIAINFLLISASVFLSPNISLASDPQKCTQSETCKIGEFLYNNDYSVNTGATCTITSRDPSGALHLNSVTLSQSNGYYSTTTTPTTLGTYPTQICCTTGTEYMCLDKTFEVVTASTTSSGSTSTLTAADVWNYSDRSLTSFGSLVSDIWNHSARSLTQAITVDSSTLATKKDLEEINKINKENRIYLEKLVNKPIIQNFIDDKNSPDLTTKIKETENVLNNLFATAQNLKTRSQNLATEWNTLSSTQIISELTFLQKIITDPDPKNSTTLISHTNWLKNSWTNEIFLELSAQTESASSLLIDIIKNSKTYPISDLYTNYQNFLSKTIDVDLLTGNSLSEADSHSAFGFLKKTSSNLSELDKTSKVLSDLLPKVQNKTDNIEGEIYQITQKILAQNQLSNYQEILNPSKAINQKNISSESLLRNKIYGLQTLININRQLLAGNSASTLKFMWLEEGSIVFRSVAYNPSKSVSQSVNVKFFLPSELKKEQILASDPELKIDYDATENALYATADISLMPQESTTLTVEAEDIWQYNQLELDILKKQASDLTDSLKGTPLYTQASSTKSDIIASLDKVSLRQKEAISPENRIKTYRESALEIIAITDKINSLKLLTAQASSPRLVFGNIGSGQSIAIGGIVLIGLAGFAFLSYYLKNIRSQGGGTFEDEIKPSPGEHQSFKLNYSRHHHKESKNIKASKLTHYLVIGLIGTGIFSIFSAVASSTYQYNKTKKLTLQNSSNIATPNFINLKISESQKIPVKSGPSLSSSEVLSFKTDQTLYVYRKLNGWAKVGLTPEESTVSWWINELYLK